MKKLVIGNWKMNPTTLEEAKEIAQKTRHLAANLSHIDVVACPPFVYMSVVISQRDPNTLKVGAQSVSYEDGGPHTGEVGAAMLKDMGVKYVILGHSEARLKGDTDDVVSKRICAAVAVGMQVVLCVGEKERDEGGAYLEQLKQQIKGSLANVPANKAKNIVLAYEPVWAVGAKEAMVPEQIYEMALFVRKVFSDVFNADQALKATVIYGGSVNFRNAADIIKIGQVDGLLVGRESVNMPGFTELLKAVDAI
ncbi:MAG: triose-phosphate isomerase [Candidatus Pacebacteria bacterium]|nr:triose-phosphate isomerase [Candidatus Paceibacterota bacterium]